MSSPCDVCGRPLRSDARLAAGVRPVLRCGGCAVQGPSPLVPAPDTPEVSTRKRHQAWMSRLGEHVRRTRCLLGLTQTGLAHAAGTSQAAISRLEKGRGVSTPYLVVCAVQRALGVRLRELADVLPEGGTDGWLESPSLLAEIADASPAPVIADTDELRRYLVAFREAPPLLRTHLLAIVEAVTRTDLWAPPP